MSALSFLLFLGGFEEVFHHALSEPRRISWFEFSLSCQLSHVVADEDPTVIAVGLLPAVLDDVKRPRSHSAM